MTAFRLRRGALAAGALAALAFVGRADAQQVAFTGSVQFASGTYFFTERTDSVFAVGGLDVSAGPVLASVSLPFVAQSNPWLLPGAHLIIPSGGVQQSAVGRSLRGRGKGSAPDAPVVLPAPAEPMGWTSGVGDPLARVSFSLLRAGSRAPAVSVSGAFKVPVASVESGLGTGEWDYGAGLSVSQVLSRTLIMVDVSYWKLGDLPGLPLGDPLSYSLSIGQLFRGGRLSVSGSILGSTQILEETAPPRSIGVLVSYLASTRRSVVVGGSVGLTETAPDLSVWIGWRLAL